MPSWSNWVGNQSFQPRSLATASSEVEVQARVAEAAATASMIRTVGTAHPFTPVVETEVLLDTSAMRGIVDVDTEQRLVRALPKTTFGDFGEPLWEHGLALANQGDIDTQSIAGAIATATHGSGRVGVSHRSRLRSRRRVSSTAPDSWSKCLDTTVLMTSLPCRHRSG